jgi:prevent-host-death family protein
MTEVTIHEAKTHLSRLIQEVLNGEEVVITRNHHPVARLVPIAEAKRGRQLGRLGGKIEMTDDFDAPLEDFELYTR